MVTFGTNVGKYFSLNRKVKRRKITHLVAGSEKKNTHGKPERRYSLVGHQAETCPTHQAVPAPPTRLLIFNRGF